MQTLPQTDNWPVNMKPFTAGLAWCSCKGVQLHLLLPLYQHTRTLMLTLTEKYKHCARTTKPRKIRILDCGVRAGLSKL